MKIVLVQPPIEDFYTTAIRTYPLGLAYLAAALEQAGHGCVILDALDPGQRTRLPLPEQLSHLAEYYPPLNRSPFKLFHQYFRFGLSADEIRAVIQRLRPDVVGISAMFTPYLGQALECARLAKEAVPGVPVIIGGAHVTAAPESVLRDPGVDWIIRGEGEQSLPALLTHLATGEPKPDQIQGVGYKNGNSLVIHPEPAIVHSGDQFPPPARHLLDPARYSIGGKPYTMLQTSRGCPHRCGFCATGLQAGGRVRQRPPSSVIDEMLACRRKWGIDIFDIEDDHFPLNRKSAMAFLTAVTREPGLRDIELTAMNGMPTRHLDDDVLRLMWRAGFRHIDLSMVSLNQDQLDRLERPDSAAHFLDVASRAADHGFATTAYIIIGLPEETPRQTLETISALLAVPVLIGPSVLYHSPATRLYPVLEDGQDPVLLRSTAASIGRPHYTTRQQLTLLAVVRFANYLKAQVPAGRSLTLDEITRSWQETTGWSDRLASTFCLQADRPEAEKILALASIGTRRILGLYRLRHRPPRFLIKSENMDHDLFAEFLTLHRHLPVSSSSSRQS